MQRRIKAKHLLKVFDKAGKRTHLVGNYKTGVIIALDMEGRLFTVLNGEVLNRVNLDAVVGQSTPSQYLNPGGDGLWPAPEGTTLGYEYVTGLWRVPPSLRSARYLLAESTENSATIIAEVDLINNQGLGIPTLFKRQISIEPDQRTITVNVIESITYIGHKPLSSTDCLLAPWTLCQFDCGPGCEVVFPCVDKSGVWDLYDQVNNTEVILEEGFCRTLTNGSQRYQIAIGDEIPWIEFHDSLRGLVVRRRASSLPEGQYYIDIRDATPDVSPGTKGVRYSVYSDTANFMEIEAVGGCPITIMPNEEIKVQVVTRYLVK
jgi:hypothetical protein